MATPEATTKQAVKTLLNKYERLWYFMPQSGIYGVWGIPDFVGVADGMFFAVETKRLDQETKRKGRQEFVQSLIRKAGGAVFHIAMGADTVLMLEEWVSKRCNKTVKTKPKLTKVD